MIILQHKLSQKHFPIINFFKKEGFETSMPILTYFSYLEPIDRCIILEKLFIDGIRNIYLLDKLLLAYVKIGRKDCGKEVIEYAREMGESEINCSGMEFKLLNIGVPAPKSTHQILEKIENAWNKTIKINELTFLDELKEFTEYASDNYNEVFDSLNDIQKKSIIKILFNVIRISFDNNPYGLKFIFRTIKYFKLTVEDIENNILLDDAVIRNIIKEMDSNTKENIFQLMLNLYDDNWESNFSKMFAIDFVCKKYNISIE